MPNHILKILLKKKEDRTIADLYNLSMFLIEANIREYRFYNMLEDNFNK